jgi:hypothetical protein
MVIVNATRVDLRDESVMPDEVFALSPISARAVQPSEADYDAIREAFMETSRGRWFLGEYAKRNRNADTSMVLDAVARIEETLAAHRQPSTPDDRLLDALRTIRSAVDQATEATAAAFDSAALETTLAPIRIGIRIIKEISWRWREIGADGRICDLIDSQLDAIEAGCGEIVERNPRAALIAAFNDIKKSIDAFADMETGDEALQDSGEATIAASPPPASLPAADHIAPTSDPGSVGLAIAEPASVQAISTSGLLAVEDSSLDAAVGPADEPVEMTASAEFEVAQPATEIAEEVREATVDPQAEAQDEAVLELVAAEMSAPDSSDFDEYPASENDDIIVTMRSAEVSGTDQSPQPVGAPVRPPIVHPFPHATPPASFQPTPSLVAPEVPPPPAIEPSLGSSIIAHGLLQPPKVPANDPLAPIRRMSQAEKIAFFS